MQGCNSQTRVLEHGLVLKQQLQVSKRVLLRAIYLGLKF